MKTYFYIPVTIIFFAFIMYNCKEKVEEKEEGLPLDYTKFEAYCKDYFAQMPDSLNFTQSILSRTKEFMSINEGTKEFAGKIPFKIFPVYSYGIKGVAYYEVWLTKDNKNPEGWLLFSVSDKDYPLVNFSHEGTPYSIMVSDKAKDIGISIGKDFKIYRFGVSYYAIEDAEGKKVSEFGEMPKFVPKDIDLSGHGKLDTKKESGVKMEIQDTVEMLEGVHYELINSYDDLKKLFPESYFNKRRSEFSMDMMQRIFPKDKHGEAYQYLKATAGYYIYRWASGTQCLYTQIERNTSFNYTNCWSGCNNNAWAGLYGWWDTNQNKVNLIPTTSTGEGCPTTRSNRQRRDVIDPVQMWFRGICNTYCSGGGGWTKWSDAYKGYKWTENQGYGYSYWYRWCNNAGCHVDLADILVDCIGNNNRPAHVGANSHFYIGRGFAQWSDNTDWTWVYCYPGWATNHNADVWIYWRDLNSSTKVFVY